MYLSPMHAKATAGNNSAGPIYNVESSLGRQAESSRPSTAAYSFGTGVQRPKFGKSGCPGPGAYRLKPDLGKQFDSSKHSSSNAVFPVATKACTDKLYLSPEHDKQGAGASTPGPNTAEQYSSLGRQRRSLHSTAARW
eukprot:jgi/Astpho2/1284/gw1.00023.43.1_t